MLFKSKPICCIETGKIYKSYTEASKELNVNAANFCKYFKGEVKSIKGYHYEHINSEDTTEAEMDTNTTIIIPDLDGEIWKVVPFAPQYQVSSLGRVKSYKRHVRLIKPYIPSHSKCYYVYININQTIRRFNLGRLVLMVFNPVDNMDTLNIIYKDGDISNNKLYNLAWGNKKRKRKYSYDSINNISTTKNINDFYSIKSVKCMETGKIYQSISDASRDTGIPISALSNYLSGKLTHTKGLHWELVKCKSRAVCIRCIETDIVYNSIAEASKLLNILSQSLSQCIKGKIKTAGGYHWEVVKDE